MMLTMLWMIGAFLLYIMRPNSIRTGKNATYLFISLDLPK